MKIEGIKGGFVQYFDNTLIEKIVWLGNYVEIGTYTVLNNGGKLIEVDKYKFEGTCTIHFHGKPAKEFSSDIIDFCTVYNSQYGIPISNDGKKLFVGSWYKVKDGVRKGLRAYDTETGEMIWRLNENKIRNVFIYDDYLIVAQAETAVLKIDINNGALLKKMKSGTLEHLYYLDSQYVLADTMSGKLCVIDIGSMSIVKNYGTPHNLKIDDLILDAVVQDNKLIISGWGIYPEKAEWIIDSDFYNM